MMRPQLFSHKCLTLALCELLLLFPLNPIQSNFPTYGGGFPGSYGAGGMSYGGGMGYGGMSGMGGMGGGYGTPSYMGMGGGYSSYGMPSMGGYGMAGGMGGSYGMMGGMGSMGTMGGMGGMGSMGMTGSMGGMGGMGMSPSMVSGMNGGINMMGFAPASSMMAGSSAMLAMMNPYMGYAPGAVGNFNAAQFGVNSMPMVGAGMLLSAGNDIMKLAYQTGTAIQFAEAQANMEAPVPLSRQEDFFPQCKTAPATEGRYTSNACAQGSVNSPYTQLAMMKILNKALTYEKNYQEIQMEGKALNDKTGVQCIMVESQRLYDKLKKEREKVEKLISDLNEQNADHKKALQAKLLAINDINSDLDGSGQAGTTRNDKKRSFQEIFNNPACTDTLDMGGLQQGIGLYQVKDMINPIQSKARSILEKTNSGEFARMLEEDIKAYERLNKTGTPPSTNSLNFRSVARFYTNERTEMQFKYDEMKKRLLADFGHTLPDDMVAFERNKGIESLPTKQYLADLVKRRDCLDNPSLTVPLSDLIPQIQQVDPQTGKTIPAGESVTLQNVRDEYIRIFNQTNIGISDLIRQVKAIENKYGPSFKVKMSKLSGYEERNQYYTVYQVVESNKKYCDKWFQVEPTAPGSSQTKADLLDRDYQELSTFVSEHQSSSQTIANKIRDRFIQCQGVPAPSGAVDCQKQFNYEEDDNAFCVKHAQKCVGNTLKCLGQVNDEIEKRENQVKSIGDQFNSQVTNIVNQNNATLKNASIAIKNMGTILMDFFPGGRLNLAGQGGGKAEDLNIFVTTPPKGNQNYKYPIIGDGDLNFLEDVTNKLNQLRTAMENQEQNIKTAVNDRLNKLKTQYQAEQKYWAELAQKCQQANAMYQQQMMAAQNMMRMQDQQRNMQRQMFCTQLQSARIYPGCEQQAQQLFSQMSTVISALGPGPEMLKVQEYQRICNNLSTAQQAGMVADPLTTPQGGQDLSLPQICMSNNTDTIVGRFTNVLRTEGFKYAMALNARYPEKPGLDQNALINLVENAQFQNGRISSLGSYTYQELTRYPSGQYLLNLAEISYLLKNTKYPKSQGVGGQRFCEYVNSQLTSNSTIAQECKSLSEGFKPTLISAGADAMQSINTAVPNCIAARIDMSLRTDPEMQKVRSLITQLGFIKAQVDVETNNALTQRMGEIASPNCAAGATSGMAPMGTAGPMSPGMMRPGVLPF